MTKVRAHPGIREQGEAACGPSQTQSRILISGGRVGQPSWELQALGSWAGAEALAKLMPLS